MNIVQLVPIAGAVIILMLGNFVFYKDVNNRVYRLFFITCIWTALEAFSEFMCMQAASMEAAVFWMRLSGLRLIVLAFGLNFVMLYIDGGKNKENKFVITLLHGSAVALFCGSLFTGVLDRELILMNWGYAIGTYVNHLWEGILALWALAVAGTLFVIVLKYYLKVENKRIKKQTGYILITAVLALFVKPVTEGVLPHLGIIIPNSEIFLNMAIVALFSSAVIFHPMFTEDHRMLSQKILETVPCFIIMTDSDGFILGVNHYLCETLDLKEDEVKGKSILVLFPPQDRAARDKLLKQMLKTGAIKNMEYSFITKKNEMIDVLLSAESIFDINGKTQGFVFAAANIKLQKEVEFVLKNTLLGVEKNYSDLKNLNTAKSNFLSMVSHELRSPLTAISGFISLLKNGKIGDTDESKKEAYELLERNTNRLVGLVSDLLDMSRIENGIFTVNKRTMSPGMLLDEVAKESILIYKEKNIRLKCDNKAGAVMIQGDFARLKQVLHNLLINAVKFSPRESVIEFELEMVPFEKVKRFLKNGGAGERMSYAHIRIKDEGIGIAAGKIDKIFEKFYQVEKTETRIHSGIGLGLAIVKEIVTAHGGEVFVESEGEGKGSRFNILIPEK